MKIKYYGMSAFLFVTENGTRIITDPYKPDNEALLFALITDPADVVTVTHEHETHNNTGTIGGNPVVYRGPKTQIIKGIKFSAVPTFHDENQGKSCGKNTIIYFEIDGIRVCHLGDLGHKLSDRQLEQIGKVDLLLIPVGGLPVMTTELCNVVSKQLKPKVIIPMHFWHKPYPCPPPPPEFIKLEGMDFTPMLSEDDFLEGKKHVIRVMGSEMELEANSFPLKTHVVTLKPGAEVDKIQNNVR
jgi:L-ascorbate metabolism protein UlaG (beta-lactamase superfamily)